MLSAPGLWGGNNPKRAAARTPDPTGVVVILREILSDDWDASATSSGVLLHVSVSDPTAKLKSALLELAGRWKGDCRPMPESANASVIHVAFPAGEDAGKTVSFTCHSLADRI